LTSRAAHPEQNDTACKASFKLAGWPVTYAETGPRGARKRSPNRAGRGQNSLLLARHAVFQRSASDCRRPVSSGLLRNSGDLLSRYNN
jgi:hypothetical protein